MIGPPLEGAHLIGAFLSTSVFGLYTWLFIKTIYRIKRARANNVSLLIQLIFLWIITSMAMSFQLSLVYNILVTSGGKIGSTKSSALWHTSWRWIGSTALTQIACLLMNVLLCWRLYVIWRRDWRVLIAPVILLSGLVVCWIMSIVCIVSEHYRSMKNAWQQASLVIGLSVNGLIIGLIAWKVWRVSKSDSNIDPFSGNFYHHVLHVLIESGALYAITILICAIFKAKAQMMPVVILTYVIPHVGGLVPTLIVLRILSSTQDSEGAIGHDTTSTFSHRQSISRPVFAHFPADNVSSQISEIGYFKPGITLTDKIQVQDNEIAHQSKISFK